MQGGKFKRTGTIRGANQTGGAADKRNQIMQEVNPYSERPRASLYNVIMRLRENTVSITYA
jgi:hypothetical protein